MGVFIGSDWVQSLFTANSAGIFFGLTLGKPIGITAADFLAESALQCRFLLPILLLRVKAIL